MDSARDPRIVFFGLAARLGKCDLKRQQDVENPGACFPGRSEGPSVVPFAPDPAFSFEGAIDRAGGADRKTARSPFGARRTGARSATTKGLHAPSKSREPGTTAGVTVGAGEEPGEPCRARAAASPPAAALPRSAASLEHLGEEAVEYAQTFAGLSPPDFSAVLEQSCERSARTTRTARPAPPGPLCCPFKLVDRAPRSSVRPVSGPWGHAT